MCIAKLVDDAVNLGTFDHEYNLTIVIFVKTIELLQVEDNKCDHCHMLGNVIRVTLVITRALSIVISRAKKYLIELVTK